MKKNKGMKIYRQRKRKNNNSNQILSLLGTCAVVFGVGIFGYYVVAVPIYDLVTSAKDETTDNSEISLVTDVTKNPEITVQNPITEAVTEATEKSVSVTKKENESVTTKASIPSETSKVTQKETPKETEASVKKQPITVSTGGCYYLTVDDLSDLETLSSAVSKLNGYKSVVLPLKTTGGYLHYNSDIETAHLSGVVSSDIKISDIVNIISECGMETVAEISTIADNIYPVTYKKSAYQFSDGVTGEWLDNKPESGGKPWLSPYADGAISYLSDIVAELTNAGIKKIICTDTYFPPFRDKDLGYIGDSVTSATRYKKLTDLINTLNDKAESDNGSVMLSVTATEVINSSSEVFKPDELGKMQAVISINMNDFSGQSISEIMKKLEDKSKNMQIVPCVLSESVSSSELSSIISSLESEGYDYYMVK